ncbi:MAG: class I SAM-dependent methyltransferase [Bacteroidota bacterium]|jgi:2-polyprenyl-3-methyl-5-hydroxy-6-metoxy-1,4-benzoquinol methylase
MIGEDIRNIVFRDTNTYYNSMPEGLVARQLISFVRKHATGSILDLGCATGNYSVMLKNLGYNVKAADINPEYVLRAKERGIEAVVIDGRVPFPDKSFDTVICFEVIEHVVDLDVVLNEAKRLAKRTVLFTTPNSEHVTELIQQGLLYEHFAELDHKNFFTKNSLTKALQKHFAHVEVKKGDGINPMALIGFTPVRMLGKLLTKIGIIRPTYHFRLFAVCR